MLCFHKRVSVIFLSFIFLTSFLFAQETKEYNETFSLSSTGTVSVDNYKGTITVEAWDKNEVSVYAKIEPDDDGWNSTSPEEQIERCEVRFRDSGNYVSIETNYEKNRGWGSETRAFVHYTIKMPATAELKIDDYKSEIKIENLNSEIELETYKGRVNIDNFSGSIVVDTYKGEVEVDFVELKDYASFDTYKGDIKLVLPSSSKFDFDFDLGRKGDYRSDFEMMMSRYNSDDGDLRGKVNGGGPTIKFSTYKGEVYLRKK